MKPEEELAAALRAARLLVSYVPMADEPHFGDFFTRHGITTERVSVPPRHDLSAADLASSLRATYEGKQVAMLVPGRRFDASGTRHGRGGGWYDRFLAAVPREWLRVGVLNASQLSEVPLTRESWDEPMDWLLVRREENWEAKKI